MDSAIILFSFIQFGCLLITLPIIFRVVHEFETLRWYVRFVIGYGGIGAIVWNSLSYGPLEAFVFMMIIYLLSCLFFLYGIYGSVEASITLALLLKIAGSKRVYASLEDVSTITTKKEIVERRLQRFLWFGDLVLRDNAYEIISRPTLLQVREYVLNFLKWLYPSVKNS